MLNIQNYLQSYGYNAEALKNDFDINSHIETKGGFDYLHLDYSIKAPKDNPMVKECRGLVLRMTDFSVVRQGFRRFMNWGEGGQDTFDFERINAIQLQEKVDGSIILVHYIPELENWFAGSRGIVFPTATLSGTSLTLSSLFWKLFNRNKLEEAEKDVCFIFELVSPMNQVVLNYPKAEVVLLGIVNMKENWEYDHAEVNLQASAWGVRRPKLFPFTSITEVLDNAAVVRDQLDEEGWVLVQLFADGYHRAKIKREEYKQVHNITSVRSLPNLVTLVINDCVTLIKAFPQFEDSFNKIRDAMLSYHAEAIRLHAENKHFLDGSREGKKSFAMAVKDTPQASLCFQMAANVKWEDFGTWVKSIPAKNMIEKLNLRELVGEGWMMIDNPEEDLAPSS